MRKLFVIILFFAVSCSPNPDKIFEDSVKKFSSGNKQARLDIEASMLKAISSSTIDFTDTEISPSSIFIRNNREVKFLYPEKFKIKIKDASSYDNFQVDFNKTHAAFLLDGVMHIYKKNGDFVQDIAAPDKNGSIKIESVIFHEEDIIYYAGGYLYRYSHYENKNELLSAEKINQNMKGLNRILMKVSGDKLIITAGIAGDYNINILNISRRNFFMKNMAVSSSRIFASASLIRYIEGGSGQWRIMEMSFADKKIRTLAEFKDIIDIEFFETCAVIEGKTSIGVFDYNKNFDLIPFDFELGGSSAGNLILISKEKYFAASAAKLMDKTRYLKQNAPALYAK
jgi:hypothetical protein